MPQVLTAQRLGQGEVVYWAEAGWVAEFAKAEAMDDGPAEAALAAVEAFVRRREVVNPYLFEVRVENGRMAPLKAREAIRAAGPTVRRDLGKQAG